MPRPDEKSVERLWRWETLPLQDYTEDECSGGDAKTPEHHAPIRPSFHFSGHYSDIEPQMTSAIIEMAGVMAVHLAKHYAAEASYFPSLWAIIGDKPTPFDSLEDKLNALEESWKAASGPRSIAHYNHFSYFQIIGMGPFAVPFLLDRVRRGSNSWFVALQAISGEKIDTPEMRGNPQAIRDAWIQWGERHVGPGKASRDLLAPEWMASEPRLEGGGLGKGE